MSDWLVGDQYVFIDSEETFLTIADWVTFTTEAHAPCTSSSPELRCYCLEPCPPSPQPLSLLFSGPLFSYVIYISH